MKNRCPKGTRRNKKTGHCEKHVVKEKKRCTNGTRKNKKTGKCEDILKDTCSICLENLGVKKVTTPCKHQFHEQCLIGWCKQSDNASCPICRQSIVQTCKEIMPFNSNEIFRYIPDWGYMTSLQIEQAEAIMKHKDFDVNVSRPFYHYTISLLELLTLRVRNTSKFVEYLLKQPGIVITDDIVPELIAKNDKNTLQLFKKYKKIPKHLKNLI
mgnify:CR=1 FL=1|tara:strand:+ start:15 stop:650 length:636 start_codon:yes stop_codon:yes gene_type:complete